MFKKILGVLLISFISFSSTYSYELSNSDESKGELIASKIESLIANKGEKYRTNYVKALKKLQDKYLNNVRLHSLIGYVKMKIDTSESGLENMFLEDNNIENTNTTVTSNNSSSKSIVTGGGGNYSKDKACNLGDGMYSYNLQITNYPGFSTLVNNFVKENNTLYYIVNATPVSHSPEGIDKIEDFLWSWDCTSKTPKQLSKDTFTGIEGIPNTTEIDYQDKNFIIIRTKIGRDQCAQYSFTNAGSKIPLEERQTCNYYKNVVQYTHYMYSRKTGVVAPLNFYNFNGGYQKYKHDIESTYNKYQCIDPQVSTMKKQIATMYKFDEYTIPSNLQCSYYAYMPYIVDIKSQGNNTLFQIRYGDGISGETGYMETIKVDLLTQTIID